MQASGESALQLGSVSPTFAPMKAQNLPVRLKVEGRLGLLHLGLLGSLTEERDPGGFLEEVRFMKALKGQ